MPTNSPKRGLSVVTVPPAKRKVQSTTTQATVENFFKPASQKEPERTTWHVVDDTLLVGKYSNNSDSQDAEKDVDELAVPRGKRRVAAFDLDSTLITTASGSKFPKTATDWKWWNPCVPEKLRELSGEGYIIIIFTNQGGVKEPRKTSAPATKFKLKVAAVLDALDIPLSVYAATANDRYRKPRAGMWAEMVDDYDLDCLGVDLGSSFLIGDAAGRDGDHSDSDRHWAANVGIGFHTPEEFFLKEAPKPMAHRFDPSLYIGTGRSAAPAFSKSNKQEIVLLVGSPGVGKSTFYRRNLQPLGFERVNQDALKTKEKCLKAAVGLLEDGESVTVAQNREHVTAGSALGPELTRGLGWFELTACRPADNTNPDVNTREAWISLAKKHRVPIRCIYFTAPIGLCQHNDAVRAFGGESLNPEKRKILPTVAFSSFASRFVEPKVSEGFQDMTRVEFQWQGEDPELQIWSKYWT